MPVVAGLRPLVDSPSVLLPSPSVWERLCPVGDRRSAWVKRCQFFSDRVWLSRFSVLRMGVRVCVCVCWCVYVLGVVWFSNRLLYKKIHFISVCVCVNWVKKRDTLGKCLFVCCFFRDYCCCYFGCSCCCCCFEVVFVVVVVVAHAKSHECILSPFSKRLLIIWHLFRVIWAWVVRYLPHLFSRFAIVRRQGCWLFFILVLWFGFSFCRWDSNQKE